LRATYPRSQVHTFRNAGLGALFTHTEEYIATVQEFLTRSEVAMARPAR
jgi:hypothetical protein